MTVDEVFSTNIDKFIPYAHEFEVFFDTFIAEAGVTFIKDSIGDMHRWTYTVGGHTVDIGYITEEVFREAIIRCTIMSQFRNDLKLIAEVKKKVHVPEGISANVYLLYLLQYIAHRGQC